MDLKELFTTKHDGTPEPRAHFASVFGGATARDAQAMAAAALRRAFGEG